MTEPAADLPMAIAVASSFTGVPVGMVAAFGEVGLTGEVRAIGQMETRLAEAKKMGFTRCLLPESNLKRLNGKAGLDLLGVKNIDQAVESLF